MVDPGPRIDESQDVSDLYEDVDALDDVRVSCTGPGLKKSPESTLDTIVEGAGAGCTTGEGMGRGDSGTDTGEMGGNGA